MILLLTGSVQLNTSWSCEEAFEGFVDEFNKSYQDGQLAEARGHFCRNYATMLKLIKKGKCTNCDITGIMDQDMSQFDATNIQRVNGYASDKQTQAKVLPPPYTPVPHAIKLWWPPYLPHWSSIDLREAGMQGEAKFQTPWCGSCWAFGITAVFEGLIQLDQYYGLPEEHRTWKFNASSCNLSEQFIMSNMWDAGNYCQGGNFIYGLEYIDKNFSTIELADHIPNNFSEHYKNWTERKPLKPKLNESDFYLPFARYYRNYKTYVLIQIYESREPIGRNATARNQVIQLLSRGIPVSGALYVTSSLVFYSGGGYVLYKKCHDPNLINHQVTFVGYGKKNGLDVWLIRNSWGTRWGDKGYFFVERGRDSYCTEHYFYTAMPKYYQKYNRTDILGNPGTRRQGTEYLDPDDLKYPVNPNYEPNDKSGFALSYALVIWSSLVAVCVCAIIAVVIAFVSRRKKRVYKVKQEQVYSIE